MGSSTEHSAYGPTHNPWDLDADPRRLRRRLAARGRGVRGAARDRHRHRRLDPPAGARSPAPSGSSRPTAGSRRYGLVALAYSLDQAGPVTRTVLDAALLHEVIGGHDPLDSTSIDAAGARCSSRPRAGRRRRPDRRCGSAWSRELGGEGYQPGVLAALPRGGRAADQGRRRGRRGRPARTSCYALAAYYLILPGEASATSPVRRDALRPAGAPEERRPQRRGRHARDPRRRLRRRGEAPHHPRHLRAVERLLRRLLRPGAEGAHADRARLRRRLRAGRRAGLARPRRPRRSSSARRSTTRWRCTSTTSPRSRPTSPASPASRSRAGSPTRTACRPASRSWRRPLQDDRLYRVGAALEALLDRSSGAAPLLDRAPALAPDGRARDDQEAER